MHNLPSVLENEMHREKLKEDKKKDKYIGLSRELKKLWKNTNCNWCSWYGHKRVVTGTWRLKNNGTSGDNPNYNMLKIDQKYCEESWRLEKICCRSNYSERPMWNADVKNSQNNINNDNICLEGARGVMVIVVGNGHGSTSSNPGLS